MSHSSPRPFAGGLLALLGLVLSSVAAVIYSDALGFTDSIFVDAGRLSLRFSRGGPIVHTPVPLSDIHASLRQIAPVASLAAGLFIVAAVIMTRRAVLQVVRGWPTGVQGLAASLFLVAALSSFLPVGDQAGVLAVYFAVGSLGFACLLTGVWWAVPRTASTCGLAIWHRFLARPVPDSPRFVFVLTAATLAGACVLSRVVFEGVPHVVDGVSQLFQARIFASGQLTLPSHALPEFFDLDTVVNTGRWFSQYTPGHAMLLAVGDSFGAPWMVNPILGAATVPALYALGRETHGASTASLAVLLLVISPFFLLMSSEYYSHASTFLFLTIFLLHYTRFTSTGRTRNALGAGAWLGMALLSRPLTALAVAIPCVVHAVVITVREGNGRRLPRLGLMAAVTLVFVGLLLLYNQRTTGALLSFGYSQAFGPGFGVSEGINWLRPLGRVIAINTDLLAWPIPALLLAAFAFLGARPSQWDYLFAAICFSLLAAYTPSGYRDREIGPRYLYEAIGPLLVISARGLMVTADAIARFVAVVPDARRVRSVVGATVATAVLLGAALGWPPRVGFYGSSSWRWAYPHEAANAIRTANLEHALVFVRGDRLWAALFLDNSLPLTNAASVIYARDRGEENNRLTALYPDRRYFVADSIGVAPLGSR